MGIVLFWTEPHSRMMIGTSESQGLFTEELYKGHVIQVTVEKDNGSLWKPICKILDGESREFIKQLDWEIGYETPDQATRVGLMVSKKWIDAGKPNL